MKDMRESDCNLSAFSTITVEFSPDQMGCPLAIYFKQSHLNFNVRCNNLLWDTSIIIYWDMFDVERLSYCKKLNYSRVPWYEITNAWGKVIEFPLIYHNV